MAYKALYRTYRPNSFDEVAGQKHIVQTLQHAVEQNKIAHAYLFCGPRGTGKTSIAKIFAKTINCTDENHKPCLKCQNCLAVSSGSHPDIIEIDAASNNGVEEVRSLIEKVKYAPLEGTYKVYIIDEVHMMSTGAFNALLKTIEEPPEHIIFILATTEPHKVLPTIISRCQRYDFTKVPRDEIIRRIHTILEIEKISCEEEAIRTIAQLADGGMRDALSILDQCIAYAQNNVKIQHINEIYGITTVEEKLTLFQNIFHKNAVELLDNIDKMIEKGIDIKRLTVDLIEILKESIIFEYTKDSGLLHIMNNDEVRDIMNSCTITQRFDMLHLLMETYDKYRSAANAGSYFEVCLLQMLTITGQQEVLKKQVTSNAAKTIVNNTLTSSTMVADKRVDVSRETSVNDIQDDITTADEDTTQQKKKELREEHVESYQMSTVHAIKEEQGSDIRPLDKEFVLALLSGATKPEKAADMESFQRISEFLMEIKWARYANMIKNSTIVASGTNYIVIGVDIQAEANTINEMDRDNQFGEFIDTLLKKNKKIFAISRDMQNVIINEFKERMISGTLPDPVSIETVAIEHEEVKEKTQEEAVLDLFGKDNIDITED